MRVLQIISGGMDSATLLYWLLEKGHEVRALSFDYGQRHKRELNCAFALCARRWVDWNCVNLPQLRELLPGSSLTDDGVATPHGHYAADNMKQTVVPSRNAFMLSMAFGVAVAHKMDAVAIGAHSGDHTIYPDCRQEFFTSLEQSLNLGVWMDKKIKLLTPFLEIDKADIVRLGDNLGVPWAGTWTCYEGGDEPCGVCGACQERREAFARAGVLDPRAALDGAR